MFLLFRHCSSETTFWVIARNSNPVDMDVRADIFPTSVSAARRGHSLGYDTVSIAQDTLRLTSIHFASPRFLLTNHPVPCTYILQRPLVAMSLSNVAARKLLDILCVWFLLLSTYIVSLFYHVCNVVILYDRYFAPNGDIIGLWRKFTLPW